ncbi:caspase family protein [Pseudanabaena sp. PCC 6802]|uniref:caspase family protein n=1 Tax=Pseudanabaena sp. PCC 6802 TaxID=118173 RepID=UPI00034A50D3|nr:caspase family protein [Pseudanabaena sp. PCC 6802]
MLQQFFSLSLTYAAILVSQSLPLTSDRLSVAQKLITGDRVAKQASKPGITFLAFGGGGSPANNEIALEKNLLYFQRTLKSLGFNPAEASIFFANGNDRSATIRYVDNHDKEKFKPPEIPHLKGSATLANLRSWFGQYVQTNPHNKQLFFYFTGHGILNEQNPDDNSLLLWQEQHISVREFSQLLDLLPAQTLIAMMMAQCYSGSFANIIYADGDPEKPLAKQNRCGFYATIKTLPSVGCTAEVNESDYRDYSSSFFAGLSGRSRTGEAVPSADYNKDGKVSYLEAHAFAKVDEKSTDLPVSTSEVWLQGQSSRQLRDRTFSQPIAALLQTARPEQRYVVNSLIEKLNLNPSFSFKKNRENLIFAQPGLDSPEEKAYLTRLQMELISISVESKIRSSQNPTQIATLDRLLKCEQGHWRM